MAKQSITTIFKAFCLSATMQGLGLILIAPTSAQIDVAPSVDRTDRTTTPSIPARTTTPTPAPTPTPVAALSGLKIITPVEGSVLDIPATTIILQYPLGETIELKVNGQLVDAKLIGRTETDSKAKLVTQTWYGVPLNAGENIIVAQTGQGVMESIKVQVRGVPTKLKIQSLEPRLPADGRSVATIIGELQDEYGNATQQDGVVTLYTSAGEFAGVDANPDQPGFQVPVTKGKFTAKLRAGLDAQTVRIRAESLSMEAYAQVQFETNLRSSIATGVVDFRLGARGTDYYRPFAEFLPPDRDNSTQLQVRGQAFATGRLGHWSVTGAFNSDRPLNKVCNTGDRLFRDTNSTQSCEDLYPVYGDTSKVDVLTPSRDSVFLKFENSNGVNGSVPNMVMWGDYNTTEFANRSQQFTATNRNLHGTKLNYNIGNMLISGFYGDNVQGFQRDNIAPDGTSGYYFLSQRFVLSGSEILMVETEEYNRPGTVIKQDLLNRGLDYDIDYDRGTILLRRPLLRTGIDSNGNLLIQRLVATYQYANGSNNSIYGGRAQFNLSRESNRESWIGASWIRENQGIRSFSILGADTRVALGANSNIIAEYARSSNNAGLGNPIEGNALRVEGQFKFGETTSSRTYFSSTESGFSNNATTSFVPGQTRYGAELLTRLGNSTSLRLQADREENRGAPPLVNTTLTTLLTPTNNPLTGLVDNDLTTITTGIQQRFGNNITLDVDYVNRNRQDRLSADPAQVNVSSDQIRSRLAVPLGNNLAFRAQNEINLSNQQDVVYPNRTALGVEWTVYPGIKLGVNQNLISSTQFGDISYTSLDFDSSYALTRSTKVTGRYSLNPFQSIGSVGLQQGFVLSPGLKLDLNYERIIGSITNTTGAGQQFVQPYSLGQTAASLGTTGGDSYGIGLNYTDNPNFQANARYEYRNSAVLSGNNLSAGVTGKLSPALTALFNFQQSSASNQVIRDAGLGDTMNLKLGLAMRNPASDEFNGLLSYQYRKNPALLPTSILTNVGTGSEDQTLALEAIYAPNWRWEFAGKFAIRNATSYLDQTLSANNAIGISQLRTTYRLGYSWDLAGDVRWLNQFASGRSEMGGSLEAGYYLTPNLRLSAGYSLGVADDPNGSRNASGPYLGLTVKINELFGGFGRQQLTPVQQQESQVK